MPLQELDPTKHVLRAEKHDALLPENHRYWKHKRRGTVYEVLNVGNRTASRILASDFSEVYVTFKDISSIEVWTTTEEAFRKRMIPLNV